MAYQSFEDLKVWQRSVDLAAEIIGEFYEKPFRSIHDQIQRSALSIPSNIAEGSERGGIKENKQFLRYAQGSSGELKTQLIVAVRAGIFDQKTLNRWLNETYEIAAMTRGLCVSLDKHQPED